MIPSEEPQEHQEDALDQRADRLGSIFSQASEEIEAKTHWKRRLVRQVYPFALVLLDVALIVMLFAVLVYLRHDQGLLSALSRRLLVAVTIPSIFGIYLIGGYNYRVNKKRYRFISEHVIASAGVFVAVFFLIYTFIAYGGYVHSSRLVVAGTLVMFPILSVLYRAVLTRIQHGFEIGNMLCCIGADERACDLYKRVRDRGDVHDFFVVSFDESKHGKHLIADDPKSPIVESPDLVAFNSSIRGKYVESYVSLVDVDQVPKDFGNRLVAARFSGHKVYTYETYLSDQLRVEPPSQLTHNWPMLDGFRLNKSVSYNRFKRACDIFAGIVGIILASPLLIGTALAVKLTSKGPIIFKQERVGLREKPFMILKFRSMRVGSEKGHKYTRKNDDRFTPIGKFIRKTRLDELPQLWNVLVGDLSLIGPRAEWIDLVEGYEKKFPYYHYRHAVKPGVTGWAQVNYSYGASDEDTLEKLNYDLYYVRRYSLPLDVAIVVKTVYMMVFGRGQ